jgi:hypothetical protein
VFTERFVPAGPGPYRAETAAVRDERYRLVRDKDGELTLYDLRAAPGDGKRVRRPDADERAARDRLKAELDRATSLRFEH